MNKFKLVTLADFKGSSFHKKCEWITKNAIYLTSKELNFNKLYLYSAGSFFIEVHYNIRKSRVSYIREFTGSDNLLPYLENISIKDLMN